MPEWVQMEKPDKIKQTRKGYQKRVLKDRSKHGNKRVVHLSYDPTNIDSIVENQRTFIRTFVLKHRL